METIKSAAARDGIVYAASKSGLYRFDGKSWSSVSGLNLAKDDIGNIAIDSKGTVWASVFSPQINDNGFWITYTYANAFAIVVAPFLLILIVLIFWFLPAVRANSKAAVEARASLKETLPDLPVTPAANTQASTSRAWLYFLGIIFVGIMVGSVVRSLSAQIILIVAAGIAVIVVPRLLKYSQTSDQQERDLIRSTTTILVLWSALNLSRKGMVWKLLASRFPLSSA